MHGRPGIVSPRLGVAGGVQWFPATHKEEDGQKVVYIQNKVGKKTVLQRAGVMQDDCRVIENGMVIGEYRSPGLFPEMVAHVYGHIAQVWKMDNEFAARWASHAYGEDHKDLKVALCAFMLVQNRSGEPIKENGEVAFFDDDFRDVGEAMCLIRRTDGKDLDPKLLLRVGDMLALPAVAKINHDLGFGRSGKNPPMGRWTKVVEKYLRNREQNSKVLEGMVKKGWRTTVMALCQRVGYKPTTEAFFRLLRWKQKQAKDGRRTLAIGVEVTPAETWEGLTEAQVCERIVKDRPSYKRISGMLPSGVGLTRAIMAATIEAGILSDKDLIILTPTLEELGLLEIPQFRSHWESALKKAEDQRASNIAMRVKKKETVEKLEEASDTAMKKAVEEVIRGLRVYAMIDKSGSMEGAIEQSKVLLERFLGGFPLDKCHVSVFNTIGQELKLKSATRAGVQQALLGHTAGGGTDYGSGVRVLQHHKPTADEDVLFVFVGDQEAGHFTEAVRASGLNPMAFAFLNVKKGLQQGWTHYDAVEGTAAELGIPCFDIDVNTFNDPYSVTRTIRNLVAATPVGIRKATAVAAPRISLVEQILKCELLKKPVWA
jgi:hypothetical protein